MKKKILLSLLVVSVVASIFIEKATYSSDTGSSADISLVCPSSAVELSEIGCDIALQVSDGSIVTAVKVNYELPTGVEYVTFTNNDLCAESECFEVYASTVNGFALVNMNGVSDNTPLGKLKIRFTESNVSNKKYTVKLKNIEIVFVDETEDDTLAAKESEITIAGSSSEITVSTGSYNVSNDKHVIHKISGGTDYSTIKNNIDTNGTSIVIKDKDNTVLADTAKAKTGDKIVITKGDQSVEYKVSILGDITGDGVVEINDVSKLYRYYRSRITMDDEYIYAGEVTGDNIIEINDVSKLYRYYRERINSLQ